MNVLFDQNIPRNLRRHLVGHLVRTAAEMGWETLENGTLLKAAETASFDVLVTGDRNLEYQQNLEVRNIAIVALTRNNRPLVKPHAQAIVVAASTPSSYRTVNCR